MDVWVVVASILLSSVKLLTTPIGLVLVNEYSLWQIGLVSSIGGILGSLIFFFLGNLIFSRIGKKKKEKKVNYKKNRKLVNIKRKFGLFGLSMSIGIVSVPVGALLVSKYYSKNKWTVPILILCSLCWGFGATYLTFAIRSVFA